MGFILFSITIIAGALSLMLTSLLLFDSFPILKVQSIKILQRYKDITGWKLGGGNFEIQWEFKNCSNECMVVVAL